MTSRSANERQAWLVVVGEGRRPETSQPRASEGPTGPSVALGPGINESTGALRGRDSEAGLAERAAPKRSSNTLTTLVSSRNTGAYCSSTLRCGAGRRPRDRTSSSALKNGSSSAKPSLISLRVVGVVWTIGRSAMSRSACSRSAPRGFPWRRACCSSWRRRASSMSKVVCTG